MRSLAQRLDIPERTLRRAASEGLIRGQRVSPRRFVTTLREEEYLRRRWPVLSRLRAALRTEPAVRLAVVFGSVARGEDRPGSDVDVLVDVEASSPRRIAGIARRLSDRLDRDVQLVVLADARRSASLMAAVLADGRVLVDREGEWADLAQEERLWRRRADREAAQLDDLPEVLGS